MSQILSVWLFPDGCLLRKSDGTFETWDSLRELAECRLRKGETADNRTVCRGVVAPVPFKNAIDRKSENRVTFKHSGTNQFIRENLAKLRNLMNNWLRVWFCF